MPIPTPTPLETRDEYISRCIADLSGEYDAKQAAAICYAQLSAPVNASYTKAGKR